MAASLQQPIDSGFGAKSTAAEVLAGIDLTGKNAVVTGGYSGIGLEVVRALEGAGVSVAVPARRPDVARKALDEAGLKTSVAAMDLADLASVVGFAADYAGDHDRLDLLINNAGIMACPETRVGPGWEAQFACNHIGHFVLANEVTPLLLQAEGARVVALSSVGHKRSAIIWDDIHFNTHDYEKWIAYGQSKTANALFAVELNRRLSGDGVNAFSVHPGGIMTPLQRHLDTAEMHALGWVDENGELSETAKKLFKTPEQGAATTLWCATSPALDERGGEYCEDCNIAELAGPETPRYCGVAEHAVSVESAARLWAETETMVASA